MAVILKNLLIRFIGVFLISLFVTTQALAVDAFPTKIPTKAEALEAVVKLIPGLDKAGVSNFKATNNTASGDIKIKGKTVSVVAFKRTGISKVLIAIAPGNFKLTTFLPIPSGTPIDGISFKDMAFVYVPKGAAKKSVATSGLPQKVMAALGSKVDFKEGLNLFGKADFASSGGIKKVLKAIGLNNFILPLNGVLSKDLFKHNPKTASANIKNQLLDALRLDLKLPKLRIPGMANTVAVKNAGLSILSRKVKNKRKFIAGVNGTLSAKVGSKEQSFAFYILADKAGANSKVTIKGDTQDKMTLPFFKPLKLTGMNLIATKSGGKWDVVVNAKAKLNNKEMDVVVIRDPKEGTSAEIKGKIKLSDLLPGGASIPGITNVEFDDLQINKEFMQVTGKVKKLDTVIAVFKRNSKTYVAINNPRPINISSLITAAKGTPLDDASFQHMTYIWAPKGGAEKGMELSALPPDIAYNVKQTVKKVDLKEGLNVIGRMAITQSSKIGKLLKNVGIHKDHFPLVGKLSPKLFKKGGGANIKNEILDALDIKVPLKISGLHLPNQTQIRDANLEIKGVKKKDGSRALDVIVRGELDAKIHNETLKMDFEVVTKKATGQKTKVSIKGKSKPGTKLTIPLVQKFTLTDITLDMAKVNGKWGGDVEAVSTLHNKKVDVTYARWSNGDPSLTFKTKMTIADLIGEKNLPGLDDIELDTIVSRPGIWFLHGKVKGQGAYFQIQKSGSKHLIVAYLYDLALTELIPGSASSPLKDVDFSNVVALYYPGSTPAKVSGVGLKYDAVDWVFQSNKHDPIVKPGLNIFGHMDIKPTGELATLLKQVGVHDLKLPLNGKIDKSMFKGSPAGSVKNAILDSLDLNIKLPKLKIPEVDKFLAFKNGRLKIKGKTPDGKRGIDVAVSGDADLRVKGDKVAFAIDVEHRKSELSFKGSTEKKWTHPLGIKFLDLDTLRLTIDKKKGAYDVKVAAKTDIGSHSRIDVNVDVREKNGHVTDAFFELDGPLKLSEIPEVGKVPHADKFSLTNLIVSEHGIEADTTLNGHPTDLYAFHGSGWNVALTQKDFNLGELIKTPGNLLKEIEFPFAAVMLSESGLNKPFNELSKVGQDALKDIYTNPNGLIDIKKGLAFVAGFHPDNSGKLGKHLKGMGVHNGMVVMGEIGGIFGGTPTLTLEGILASAGASKLPKFMNFLKSEHLDFYISASEEEFDIGLDVGLTVKIKSDLLTFDTKIAVKDVDAGELGIGITGGMEGTWHKPFDIPGLSIDNVLVDSTMDDAGLKLGFTGTTTIANEKISIASDIQFSEAIIPDAVAFKGSVSEVDIFFIEEIATNMIGKAFKLDIPQGIFPKFNNVSFAFVSSGAEDQAIGLTSEGFGLSGGMDWLGHKDLGTMKLSISPTSGIYADGGIKPINLGPLELKENHFNMKVGITEPVPSIKLKSNIKIEYLGLHEDFDITLNKNGVNFDATANITKDLSLTTEFQLSGIDLSVTKPGFKDADFFMEGDLKLNIGKFIGGPVQASLNDVFDGLDSGFKKAEKTLAAAKKKVDGLTRKINAEREKVRKERQKAEKKVEDAKKRVDKLNKDISSAWNHYHGCGGLFGWICKGKYGFEILSLKGLVGLADESLKLVKGLTNHFPIDLDPRVGFLISERDTADGLLTLAEDGVKGADVITRVEKEATDKITSALTDSVNIKKAGFAGDFRAMIEHDAPVILALDVEVFGGEIKQTLPFKIKDLPYDVEQMGIVGVKGLWHLADKVLGDIIPAPLKHKIRNRILHSVKNKANGIKSELATFKTDFAKYGGIKDAVEDAITAQSKDYMKKDHYASVLAYNPLDSRATKTFANDFVEAGHTGLCLDSVNGEVKQDKCTDGSASRWSTVAVQGDNKGYQNIVVNGTTKCIAPEGTWKTVKKTFTSPKFGNTDSFSYETNVFSGDGKLSVRDCKDTEEYKWKVLPHGDGSEGWLQISNKATGRCLHFSNSNALPGHAVAKWEACVGSANQVFRVADKLTPTYHKVGFAMRNDQLGLCVGEAAKDGTVSMVDCSKPAWYDYMVNYKGDVKFINRASGHCLQPSGYAIGAKMIEAPCTQLDYQWWQVTDYPGGFLIKNAQTKQCTQPPLGTDRFPKQVDCKDRHNSLFTGLGDPNQGPHWHDGYTTAGVNLNMPGTYSMVGNNQPTSLCTAKDKAGGIVAGSFVNDNIAANRICDSIGTKKGGGYTINYATHYSIMTKAPATEWVANSGGKLPENAIATGGLGTAITYSCRTKNNEEGYGKPSTYLGWTTDGKTCVSDSGTAKNFEIFTRSGSIFRFNVSSPGVVKTTPVSKDKATLASHPVKSAPVWIVGLGNAPYAWDPKSYGWIRQKGCLKQISVAHNGIPVGIQCDDLAVTWTGTDWVPLGAKKGRDIDSGAKGSTWMVDLSGAAWEWTAGGWHATPGCLNRIDVMSNGTPVGIGCDTKAYYLKGTTWISMANYKGFDIGTGDGQTPTWYVGTDKHAWLWKGYWVDKGGCLARIDVAGDGNAWAVGCKGGVLAWNGSGWKKMPGGGVLDIGLQP